MKTMLLYCEKCGKVFEDNECQHLVETTYLYGNPVQGGVDLATDCCPHCGGIDLTEVQECDFCGEFEEFDNIHTGICEKCLLSLGNDFDVCLKVGEEDEQGLNINGFIRSVLTDSEIETILTDAAKEKVGIKPVLLKNYILQDFDFFAERFVEGVKR